MTSADRWTSLRPVELADFYDCNRSDAIAYAAVDVVRLAEAAQAFLERDDMTKKQRQEISKTLS